MQRILTFFIIWVAFGCGAAFKKKPIMVSETDPGAVTINVKPSNLKYQIDTGPVIQGKHSFRLNDGVHRIRIIDPCHQTAEHTFTHDSSISKSVKIQGVKRVSRVKLMLKDDADMPSNGTVLVDKIKYGDGSGTYQVPLCSQLLEVEAGLLSAEAPLELIENKTTLLSLVLKQRGYLTQKQIETVISENMNTINQCFLVNTKTKRDYGNLRLYFGIRSDGSVYFSKIRHTNITNKAITSCIVDESKTWVFPEPRGGGSVKVEYPFSFARLKKDKVKRLTLYFTTPNINGNQKMKDVMAKFQTIRRPINQCIQKRHSYQRNAPTDLSINYRLQLKSNGEIESLSLSYANKTNHTDRFLKCVYNAFSSIRFKSGQSNTVIKGSIKIEENPEEELVKKSFEILYKIQPRFPLSQSKRAKSLYCNVEFKILSTGKVQKVNINKTDKCPVKLHRSLKKAFGQWRFKPTGKRETYNVVFSTDK